MVDLALTHGYDRAATRLVTVIVVQANLAEGRKAHLEFKRSESLRPRTPVYGTGHLANDVFEVLDILIEPSWSRHGR